MSRTIAIALGVGVALAAAATLDLVVTGSVSVVPLGALAAAVGLVVGAKSLGTHVLSRPAGSRPGELGDPDDDLVDDLLTNVVRLGDGPSDGVPADGDVDGDDVDGGSPGGDSSRTEREEGSGA